MTIVLALALGILAGLRAATPLAAVSWAARLGFLHLAGTWLSWLASPITAWVLTVLALGEIVNDKLPNTPSRKIPPQFIGRCVTGGFAALTVGVSAGMPWLAALGVVGAVIGTLGGSAIRGALARAFGRDLPAALLEDAVTVGGAAFVVSLLR
jgi:uncharacterized membrane protein